MSHRVLIAFFFLLLIGLPAFTQNNVFITPPKYPAGSTPISIAIGDFNGDGKLDLALMDFGGPVILLGNGDGTFQPPVQYSVPGGGSVGFPGIVVADFNGDGKPDLAVANGQELSVLLGNGDGTFQAAASYGTDGGASSLAVGDFNGDGKPDLVVVGGSSSVSIFLNSGSGTFPTRTDFTTGYFPTSVVVGDFNGDGKLDLAVANLCGNVSCGNPGVANGSVSVLLGNGNGTFQPHVEYAAGSQPISIAVGNLNGDGNLDLAVLNAPGYSGYPAAGSVSLLFGNGDGTFQSQVVYPTGLNPSSIAVADFNGDGQLDFAVINGGDSDAAVYLNQGHGSFAQPTAFSATFAGAAVAADFNGDGKIDLAVLGNAGNTSIVSVLLGRGDGSFSQTGVEYPALNPAFVAAADVNGDGKDDVVAVNNSDNNVGVFLGNGNGTFQAPVNYNTGHGPQSVAIADLNGDGKPDLAVVNMTDNTVSVLLNNGAGTFAPHVDYPTAPSPVFVAVGDVNGDGKPDLLVACLGEVSILLGNGDGTFQAATNIGPGGWSLALGDFNGDGFLDFAVAAANGVNVFLNNGHGAFGSQPLGSARIGGPTPDILSTTVLSVVAGDFNGDGKLDLAVSATATLSGPGTLLYLGNGDGTFQSPQGIGLGYGSYPVVADFNGDGTLDMAFAGGLMLGEGNGVFSAGQVLPTAAGEGVVAAGDFNGDGRLDLVVANGYGFFPSYSSGLTGSNTLTVWLNAGVVAPTFTVTTAPSSQVVTAGDSTTFTIMGTAKNGFTGSVALSCSGLPTGASCAFSAATIKPAPAGVNSTMTISTSASTPKGSYSVAVTGASGNLQLSAWPTLTVNPAPPDFSVSVPSSMTPNSVMPGQSATATVTLGSSGGFSGTVTLACSVSPAMTLGPTCTFSKQQVPVSSSGTATSTLTVSTTGPTASLGRPASNRGVRLIYAAFLSFFGLACFGLGTTVRNKRQNTLLALMICCFIVGGSLLQVACGGKSSTRSSGGTPGATYTITVTASSSSQHTTSLKLTVH